MIKTKTDASLKTVARNPHLVSRRFALQRDFAPVRAEFHVDQNHSNALAASGDRVLEAVPETVRQRQDLQ
ncbi:hypothetical protein [Novosphingobium sp.]|uniref:hypothetical protein n=1 Tax=Novosphingobium sp. TaxID=1874826 RepID=UPI003B527016